MLGKNLLITPLALVAALLGTGVWLAVRPLHYRATATIRVMAEGPGVITDPVLTGVIAGPGDLQQTGAQVIASQGVAGLTAQTLGGGFTGRQVSADVSVRPGRQPEILDVDARSGDARLAVRVANDFTLAALKLHLQWLMRQAVRVMADVPKYSQAEIAVLRSALKGVDPTFKLQALASGASSTDESAWALLGLALIPGLALGLVGALIGGFLALVSPATPGTGPGVASLLGSIGNRQS
jgi:hypothetical protein